MSSDVDFFLVSDEMTPEVDESSRAVLPDSSPVIRPIIEVALQPYRD